MPSRLRNRVEPPHFALGLDVDLTASRFEKFLDLAVTLSRSGKDDPFRSAAGRQSLGELASRSNLEPASEIQESSKNGEIGIGFDGVEDLEAIRKRVAQHLPIAAHAGLVINE